MTDFRTAVVFLQLLGFENVLPICLTVRDIFGIVPGIDDERPIDPNGFLFFLTVKNDTPAKTSRPMLACLMSLCPMSLILSHVASRVKGKSHESENKARAANVA